jgi:hypothetical protein
MNAVGLETRVLAMSLETARSGVDAARIQQQQPAAQAAGSTAETSDVILELSSAAQALIGK